MKKNFLINLLSVLCLSIGVLFSVNLFAKDGGEDCTVSVLYSYQDFVIINNAKNRWFGLAAGCKAKCGRTCTCKRMELKIPGIDIN